MQITTISLSIGKWIDCRESGVEESGGKITKKKGEKRQEGALPLQQTVSSKTTERILGCFCVEKIKTGTMHKGNCPVGGRRSTGYATHVSPTSLLVGRGLGPGCLESELLVGLVRLSGREDLTECTDADPLLLSAARTLGMHGRDHDQRMLRTRHGVLHESSYSSEIVGRRHDLHSRVVRH